MSIWDTYPDDYRSQEVSTILKAVQAGECVSVVGLSGAGKSNLLGFISNRPDRFDDKCFFRLVDCNQLADVTPTTLYNLVRRLLGDDRETTDEFQALNATISQVLETSKRSLCLLFDRFDILLSPRETSHEPGGQGSTPLHILANNLRALRDAHKYALTFVIATRRSVDPRSELAELFYAGTIWLGPLSESDARWNITRYAIRRGSSWDETITHSIYNISRGYPSFLRAICEAYADGATLEIPKLLTHPAVRRRLEEFWADKPSLDDLQHAGLEGHPLLGRGQPDLSTLEETGAARLTAKEHLLLTYFRQHPTGVCEKDDLIRAVWPEDKVYENGIRDDSLAQLVRRLREKIEPDPSTPTHIQTVPGRGYRFKP